MFVITNIVITGDLIVPNQINSAVTYQGSTVPAGTVVANYQFVLKDASGAAVQTQLSVGTAAIVTFSNVSAGTYTVEGGALDAGGNQLQTPFVSNSLTIAEDTTVIQVVADIVITTVSSPSRARR